MLNKPLYFTILFVLVFFLGILGEKYAKLYIQHEKAKETLAKNQLDLMIYANERVGLQTRLQQAKKEIEGEGCIITRFNSLNASLK